MLNIGCSNWNELAAYALVYGFSQDEQSWFQGSISYIQEWLMCSKPTAVNTLKKLVEKGLVIKEQYDINGVTFNKYKAIAPKSVVNADVSGVVQNLQGGSKKFLQGVKNTEGGSKNFLPNNNIDNNIPLVSISTPIVVDTLTSPKGECERSAAEVEVSAEEVSEVSEVSREELEFEDFRKAYKGTKRGLKTEFDNFKRHKDWKQVLPTLKAAYEHQCALKDAAREKGSFVAQEKNLRTYINQRCWEEEPQFDPPRGKLSEQSMVEKMRETENLYQAFRGAEQQRQRNV